MSTYFRAQFPGRCAADCGEPIRPGDDITDLYGQYVHVQCADQTPYERPVLICQYCHLTTPCEHTEEP